MIGFISASARAQLYLHATLSLYLAHAPLTPRDDLLL
jgi:hypothetical protein